MEAPIDYIPPHWVKLWGIDFGIGHPFGASLWLWDTDNDVFHLHYCFKQADTLPITERDIPNVFVSVLLVKGRTKKDPDKDGSDPGKPAFRLGYVKVPVKDPYKELVITADGTIDGAAALEAKLVGAGTAGLWPPDIAGTDGAVVVDIGHPFSVVRGLPAG